MQVFNENDSPRINFTAGMWTMRKASIVKPPPKKFRREAPVGKLYKEARFALTPDSSRQLGIYLRDDFARNDNPPVFVIVGGLGFGGPVAANKWRSYLNDWNPVLIDTRGARNSLPLADPGAGDTNETVDDILKIMQSFGLREVGVAGYSFAGTLALLTSAKMLDLGMKPTFTAAISPTLASSDRDWCFDIEAIGQTFPDNIRPMALQRWNNLVAPLSEAGKPPTQDNILSYYSERFRDASQTTDEYIQNYIRMALWEDAPYCHIEDGYTVDYIKDALAKALLPGRTIDDFIQDLAAGKADLFAYFQDPEQAVAKADIGDIDATRKKIRGALDLVRRMSNIICWTEAWEKNCGISQSDVATIIDRLQESRVNTLITFNSRDILLPPDQRLQAAQLQSAWPDNIVLTDTHLHGHEDDAVKQTMFDWFERVRSDMWDNIDHADRRDKNRTFELDLAQSLKASSDPIIAAYAMALTNDRRGDRDAVASKTAELLTKGIRQPDDSPQVEAEAQRVLGFARAKLEYLKLAG